MGQAALEGQPGVEDVENGWSGRKEVNHVVYDSKLITVKEMEQLLIVSGTYRDTIHPVDGDK